MGPDFDLDLLGIEDFFLPNVTEDKSAIEDEIPENVDTRSKLGDIWTLGNHRLMCGDSTSIDAVEKLMDGEKADMVFTDPPYGINDLPDPCHTGFKVFLWFMRTFEPRYLVHGHVHLYDRNAAREAHYGNTTIINAYDHVVIDLESNQ